MARHYSVTTTQKTLDWLALIGSGVQIYGTRAMVLIADRKKAAPAKPATGGPAVVSSATPGVQLSIVPAPADDTHG